jgi:hypothetical protein
MFFVVDDEELLDAELLPAELLDAELLLSFLGRSLLVFFVLFEPPPLLTNQVSRNGLYQTFSLHSLSGLKLDGKDYQNLPFVLNHIW